MLELGLTKDAPGAKWCKIWEIEEELYGYEAEIFPKYRNCFPFKLWVCFRCLPKEYERKPMRRFYKNDNALGIDIAIEEEAVRPFIDGKYHPLSKDSQRLLMGDIFYSFLVETFKKYKRKLAGIQDFGEPFLNDTREWLCKHNWLET